MLEFLIALVASFSTYMIFVGVWRRSQQAGEASAVQQRLREFQAQSALGQEVMDAQIAQREEQGFMSRLGDTIAGLAFGGSGGQGILDKIEEKLILSGRPHGWYAQDYIAFVALFLGGTLVGGALFVQAGVPGLLYVLLVSFVAYYCWWELTGRIASRQEQARFELPYFLDELVMSLSSGASSLDLVLREVVSGDTATEGGKHEERVLVTELRRAYQEVASQTRPFDDAYRAAAARIQVQPVSDLIEVLIQGQSGGAPILDILRDMSDNVYNQYEQDVNTLIKKKDTTFTIATVIIMLGAAVVIGAPIFDTVIKSLSGNA